MAKTTLTRKELFDLVWSEPLASISRRYNISYNCLREVCQEMNIWLPPNGYWSKLQFGKTVEKEQFRESTNSMQEITLWLRSDVDGVEYVSKKTSDLQKRKTETFNKINVPKRSRNVSSEYLNLISTTRQYYSQKTSGRWDDWDYSKRDKSFEISVSKPLLNRAFGFMEQFIEAIEQCGHSIILKNRNTYVVIFGEELEIAIVEKNNRVKDESSSYGATKLVPNGKLCLRYRKSYTTRDWVDSGILIEDKIIDIIAGLELIASNDIKERKEIREYWAAQDLIKEKEKAIQARKDQELEAFKSMFALSKRYQEANELRNYINAFEQNAKDTNTFTSEKQHWIDWARKKADWYDPFLESDDELLQEVDKELLTFKKRK